MQRIPTMQFTIDKHDTKNGKQIIRFKLADFASVLMIVFIILINILVRTTIPIEPKYGVIVSVFIYIYSLGIYNQQLGQFKEELKLIQKELNDKNEN